MATEQEYDDVIAPMLREVAQRCSELGMSLVARVEWAPDEVGITQIGFDQNTGVGQKLTQLAAHSRGNIDALCINAMRQFDCSQSMVLGRLQSETPRVRD